MYIVYYKVNWFLFCEFFCRYGVYKLVMLLFLLAKKPLWRASKYRVVSVLSLQPIKPLVFFPVNQPVSAIIFKMATSRDREILNAIVNPLLPIGEGVFDDSEKIPQDLKDDEDQVDTQEYR